MTKGAKICCQWEGPPDRGNVRMWGTDGVREEVGHRDAAAPWKHLSVFKEFHFKLPVRPIVIIHSLYTQGLSKKTEVLFKSLDSPAKRVLR